MKTDDVHPACMLFPDMTEEEYQQLKSDIQAHGQREPCVFYQGQLIDGRHRWRACTELGIKPDERVIKGDDFDPIAYVVSANLHRRHLTTSQRSIIGAAAEEMLSAAAKERQRAAGGDKRSATAKKSLRADLPEPVEHRARDDAAKLVGVSPRMISEAKAIKKADPKLAEAVRDGKVTVHAARRMVTPKAKPKQASNASTKQIDDDDRVVALGDELRRAVEAIKKSWPASRLDALSVILECLAAEVPHSNVDAGPPLLKRPRTEPAWKSRSVAAKQLMSLDDRLFDLEKSLAKPASKIDLAESRAQIHRARSALLNLLRAKPATTS